MLRALGAVGASAFTVGNVITSRHDRAWLDARPALLRHEERHTWQYVACLGLPMVPLYLLAAGWSYLRGGDPAVHNAFERLAGLEDGGYPTTSARVRRASDSAAARRAGSCLSSPGYSVFTIHAHEPEGTTTCSDLSKSFTVRAATRAAS